MNKRSKLAAFLIIFVLFLRFFAICPIAEKSCALKSKPLTSAEAMATVEVKSGRVLYSKDSKKRLPMASTTKIITAICAIESGVNLDEKKEIPKVAVGIEGSSIYLRAGEHLTLRELLYGLMLRSGNDAAVAIAVLVSGSVDGFVQLMNAKCQKLGLTDTHIVTVNGLHDDDHYTCAEDLAKITAYALQNKTFREIVSTKEKMIDSELDKKYKCRYLKNKNKLLNMIDGADGVKTGYTKKAGRCFVGSATRNGMQIVCVVLNCNPMFEDTAKLIEKAFAEYHMFKLFSKGCLFETEIENGTKKQKIPVIIPSDIYYPLTKEEIKEVKGGVELKDNLKAPINQDEVIGKLDIKLENNLIFSQKLYTIKVEKQRNKSVIKKIFETF